MLKDLFDKIGYSTISPPSEWKIGFVTVPKIHGVGMRRGMAEGEQERALWKYLNSGSISRVCIHIKIVHIYWSANMENPSHLKSTLIKCQNVKIMCTFFLYETLEGCNPTMLINKSLMQPLSYKNIG